MTRPAATSRVAWATVVIGLVAFVVIAVLRVPWHPVPGGPVHPVPADSVFTRAQISRADDYVRLARVWSYASLAVSLLLAALLGLTSWGARVVGRVRGPWWWQVVVAVLGVEVLTTVVTLPFGVLLHRRQVAFGLSEQAWGPWLQDQATGLAVSTVAVVLGLWLLVGCARRLPRAWPAVAGGLLAGLVMLGSFVYPLLVEPLSNHFRPLPDGSLRTGIERLAAREGVHVDDVLVADASRRTTTLNAYVSGFGSSRRVVVYDNLVDDVDRRQVLSIIGHELGHARDDDVLTGSLLGAAAAPLGVGLLALLVGGEPLSRRVRRPGAADGVDDDDDDGDGDGGDVGEGRSVTGVADPRAVPRVLALVVIAMLVVSPVENTISRRLETRADVTSLRFDGDPQAFIAVQRTLAVTALADPDPPALAQLWFGTHPTALTRIAIAERAEREGWAGRG